MAIQPRGRPRYADGVALSRVVVSTGQPLLVLRILPAAFDEDPCPSPSTVCCILYCVTSFRGLSTEAGDTLQ